MDDKDKKNLKPGMPPLPPGMSRPNLPLPPGGKPPMPSMPPMQQAPFPAMPQGVFQQPAAPQPPQKDDAEARRLQEEKDRLENKINDMEKLLSAEKEKALLATLKNQQDEALSSRVESSLKDIQDKMRRDRRDHEVEEERLGLKSKIKELETRLSQERETWMQTLKENMSERETQGRDVEGHFIYRLQEMERRWLDEKAQWQKEITSREDTIRSLKSSDEKLRDVQDEFRRVSLEKSLADRENEKLKEEVARAQREKASVESYIKIIPDKEREIAELRAGNAILRGREGQTLTEAKYREEKHGYEIEKLQKEIGRLQSEIGTLSDRKNSEMNEALKKEAAHFEAQLQDKEKTIAEVSGDKVRAISELMKLKGFVSRVQAINAVLDKERGQLKLDKMQLAQTMAAQVEDIRRLKQELDGIKTAHQAELESHASAAKAEISRIKNGYGVELAHKHAGEMAEAARVHQEDVSRLAATHQAELSNTISSHQAEISRLNAQRQEEAAKAISARQEDAARMAAAHQEELNRISAAHQEELARIAGERQSDFDSRVSQMRMKFEASSEEEKNAVKRQLEAAHVTELQEARNALAAASETAARLEAENRRLAAEAEVFEKSIASRAKDSEDRLARAYAELRRRDEQAAAASSREAEAAARAAEASKAAMAAESERQRLSAEYAALREKHSSMEARVAAAGSAAARLAENMKAQTESLRLESENRSRFESEVLFLKQKVQQMEMQAQETAAQLDNESSNASAVQAAAAPPGAADGARIEELSAELERYKAMEASFPERMKWALKGKKE